MSRDEICTLGTAVHPFQLYLAKLHSALNTDEYSRIRDALFSHTFSYEGKKPRVNEYIKQRVDYFNELPQVPTFQCKKLETFTFDEIEVHKDDTHEIKKFIRKANHDFIGYHCNHKVYDEQYEMSRVKFMKLIESKAFQSYTNFISHIIYDIITLIEYDNDPERDKINSTNCYCFDYKFRIVKHDTINLCSELMTINAKSCPKCAKCEAKRKLYNYVLREVERMRSELVEEVEDGEPSEITDCRYAIFFKGKTTNTDRPTALFQ